MPPTVSGIRYFAVGFHDSPHAAQAMSRPLEHRAQVFDLRWHKHTEEKAERQTTTRTIQEVDRK
jgi:hypothetical protein